MPSKRIIRLAEESARASTHSISRIGCVVYKGAGIKSITSNTPQFIGYRRDVFEFSPTRHAEINALHNVPRESLKGSDLLVYRLDKNGNMASAKPCRACIEAIVRAGLRRVHYTSYDGTIKTITVSKINLKHWTKEIYA